MKPGFELPSQRSGGYFILSNRVISSAYLKRGALLTELSTGLQSRVYTKNSAGELTQPWGAPLFVVMTVEMVLLILTHCFLSVRKSLIHLRKDGFTTMAFNSSDM